MTPVRQTANVAGNAIDPGVVHLLVTGGQFEVTVESPERVMEEIEARATRVSSVLEGIFLEPHGNPDWGIND